VNIPYRIVSSSLSFIFAVCQSPSPAACLRTAFESNPISAELKINKSLAEEDRYIQIQKSRSVGSRQTWINYNKWIYSVYQKQYTWLLITSSANVDRFTKFVYCQMPEETLYTNIIRILHLTLDNFLNFQTSYYTKLSKSSMWYFLQRLSSKCC